MTGTSHSEKLESRLRAVESAKEGTYDKRTEHLDAEGKGLFINRLVEEDSPYLLQHAHNPVNWFPWGQEAFAVAKAENKPVFLSIGYSTCHWCHVMEVESFDNIEVSKVLNRNFISIKMDREQYPDIDETYMTGVQLISGQGGWPMSNFLLPDGKPFFAATYFPAAGFINVLNQITEAWQNKQDEIVASAEQVSNAIVRILSDKKPDAELDEHAIDNTLKALFQREDRSKGGLAGEPKFPQEPLLLFLLDYVRKERNLAGFGFIERALDGMGRGGIYDQVGGGFHRYSVDEDWLVPHFEKMLYNQSQLADVYLQAYQLSANPFFERVCSQTLDYVLRDMQIPDGGFYSATDADSEGEEGVFFTWTPAQLNEALEPAEVDLVSTLYGVSEFGNFEGATILCLNKSLEQYRIESDSGDFYEQLDSILEKLYQARELRIHPLRDDKLIVAWASAMSTVLLKAGFVLKRKEWLLAATKAIQSILRHNVASDGGVQRIFLGGTSSIAGQLEDYVSLVEALVWSADISGEAHYLIDACRIMKKAVQEFWDEELQGFYLSPKNQLGPQLTRSMNASDGASLSPIACAMRCLKLLDDRSYLNESVQDLGCKDKLRTGMSALMAHVNDNPISHPSLLALVLSLDTKDYGMVQTIGQGMATVMGQKVFDSEAGSLIIELKVKLAEGWHVTAPQGKAHKNIDNSSYVELALFDAPEEKQWTIETVNYPESSASLTMPGPSAAPSNALAIYSDEFSITAQLGRTQELSDALIASVLISLTLQLCSNKECSLPVTLQMRL